MLRRRKVDRDVENLSRGLCSRLGADYMKIEGAIGDILHEIIDLTISQHKMQRYTQT